MMNVINQIFSPQNDFFLLTKDSRKLTHVGFSSFLLPIFFIAFAALPVQFLLAPLIIGAPQEAPAWMREVFALFFLFGFMTGLIFLWVKFYEGREIYTLGFTKKDFPLNYLKGFLLGVGMNGLVVIIIASLGGIDFSSEAQFSTDPATIGIVILFFFGFIVQGASEEILSRGWMFQVIGARYKPWLGVLISSIVFMVLHLGNQGINVISVINLTLFALMMALFVMNDSSIWVACGWHSAWNWTLGNFFGLSVSGMEEKVSIIHLHTKGNELISGGGFGPEGSLITTVVLLITIIIVARMIIKKNKISE